MVAPLGTDVVIVLAVSPEIAAANHRNSRSTRRETRTAYRDWRSNGTLVRRNRNAIEGRPSTRTQVLHVDVLERAGSDRAGIVETVSGCGLAGVIGLVVLGNGDLTAARCD